MAYIVENNGVYGLTKGQFSATADKGSQEQEGRGQQRQPGRPGGPGAATGRHLCGAQLLGRQGAAGAADQGRHRHGGAAFIDVISPCVTFNNHAGSTKSYDYVREHNEAVSRIDFIPAQRDHGAVRARRGDRRAAARRLLLRLRKLHTDYDPTDRKALSPETTLVCDVMTRTRKRWAPT
jgi:2-oxoglutarate ferredoxin oxidoreductase subunit beta